MSTTCSWGAPASRTSRYLQASEPVRRMLGAARIPDPTTAGDFLRRFDAGALEALDSAIDVGQEAVWKRRYGRKKAGQAIVDLDSHVHPVYGDQKEGADFSYKGPLAYHPLVISLAETQECLRLINRPGNTPSAEGAESHLDELFPMLLRRFRQVVVRGDSAFCNQKVFDTCEAHGQCFAVVSPAQQNFEALAEALPEAAWKPYRGPGERARRASPPARRRKRRPNLRRRLARARGKHDLRLERQWVAEIPYRPERSRSTYRLVIRRQRIEEHLQGDLFELWRYRYVLTNLPPSTSHPGRRRPHLPALRPGERHRAAPARHRRHAHADRRAALQRSLSDLRPTRPQPQGLARPAGLAPRDDALGVEALPARLRLCRRPCAAPIATNSRPPREEPSHDPNHPPRPRTTPELTARTPSHPRRHPSVRLPSTPRPQAPPSTIGSPTARAYEP